MPIPNPEPGLVISYLWHYEHQAGREEGQKDRPSVIVLAVEREAGEATVVTVLPITHSPPADPASATLKNDPELLQLEREAEEKVSELQAGEEKVREALDQLIDAHHDRGLPIIEGSGGRVTTRLTGTPELRSSSAATSSP